MSSHWIQHQHTTASWCRPTPLSIGHAGTSIAPLQGVPSVTGVGHCGSKGCTRATLLTICGSIRSRTTFDSYREGIGTTFPVATMQAHAIQCKLNGMQVFTCKIMQADLHNINYNNIHNHTDAWIYMNHIRQHEQGVCEDMHEHVHTNYSNLVKTRVRVSSVGHIVFTNVDLLS